MTAACIGVASPSAFGGLLPSAQPEGLGAVLDQRGLWLGLVAVFFGGLALNLTPCVYPMIPVTLAFFSGQAPGATARTALLAFCYVIGISFSYAVLGVVAAKTGSLLGSWLQQPSVLIGVALVIVALSLSMFGLYDLRPPQVLTRRLGQASTGIWGAFVMGLAVGVIAAPCIGPFVLGLFLFVGQLANPLTGFLVFFVLGLGMGLPYVALALGVSSMGRLPKAGTWLMWSKKILGVVLLGLALYFLKPLVSSRAFVLSVAALLVLAGAYLGWLERGAVQGRLFPWIRRMVGVALVVAGVAVVMPRPAAPAEIVWEPLGEAIFQEAQRSGRPIVVDVYADWCLPCLELDHVTFRHPGVVEALSTMATFRLDATREISEEAERFLERYRIYGVPTVLLFGRSGEERRDLRLLGFVRPKEFLKLLERL